MLLLLVAKGREVHSVRAFRLTWSWAGTGLTCTCPRSRGLPAHSAVQHCWLGPPAPTPIPQPLGVPEQPPTPEKALSGRCSSRRPESLGVSPKPLRASEPDLAHPTPAPVQNGVFKRAGSDSSYLLLADAAKNPQWLPRPLTFRRDLWGVPCLHSRTSSEKNPERQRQGPSTHTISSRDAQA